MHLVLRIRLLLLADVENISVWAGRSHVIGIPRTALSIGGFNSRTALAAFSFYGMKQGF